MDANTEPSVTVNALADTGEFSGSHVRFAAYREPATKKHTIRLFEGTEVFEAPRAHEWPFNRVSRR